MVTVIATDNAQGVLSTSSDEKVKRRLRAISKRSLFLRRDEQPPTEPTVQFMGLDGMTLTSLN